MNWGKGEIIPTKSTFLRDKAVGEAAEVKIQKYLNSTNPDCYYSQSQGNIKTHDLFCLMHGERVEVKNDRMAPITGNICFERNLFAHTRSQTIIYVIKDTAYIYQTKQLWEAIQQLAREGKTTFKMLGDGNRNPAILVKVADITPSAEQVKLEGE